MTVSALFVSSVAKNTAAPDVFTAIKANLAPGVTVNGSGHIEHRNSRTGLVDPAGGIHNWDFPDRLIESKYQLPLPDNSLVSDFKAVLTALDGLATPPNGYSADPVSDSPADPSYHFNTNRSAIFEWSFPYINKMHKVSSIIADTGERHKALVDGGYLSAAGDIVSLPPGAANISKFTHTMVPATAEMEVATRKQHSLICGIGDGTFGLLGWANAAGTAGNRTADFAAGNGNLVFTGAASDIYLGRTDWLNLHKAGAYFNPNYAKAHKIPRILRFMDYNRTNDSAVAEVADTGPESQYYWALFSELGVNDKYYGPPISVMVRMCNELKCDMHYCIPQLASDAFIDTVSAYIRDNLDPDLRCYFEYANENWNTAVAFTSWLLLNQRGIDQYNKATASTAGTGYTAGDEVTGGSWTVTIDTVSAGVPQTFTVTARGNPVDFSAVAMTGGTGTGLALDFTNYGGGDFPYLIMGGFTSARIGDRIKTVYGVDWGTKAQMVLGIQSRNNGMVGSLITGVGHYTDGIAGHPTLSVGSGDAFSDLIHIIGGATYNGPTVSGTNLTSVEAWLATSQQTLNQNFPALADDEMITNLAQLALSKTEIEALGAKMLPYEGGWHCDIDKNEAQSTIDGMAAYRESPEGIAQRSKVELQYQDIFGPIMSQLATMGSPESGDPWYLMDHEVGFDDPRWTYAKTYNESHKGSDWDTGRTTDFSVGPYFGVVDYDGDVGGSSLPVMIGGHGSYFYGDGTNVAVMPLPGICTDVDIAVIPGVAADYTVSTGPNGCKQLAHASHTLPWRFNPDEVTTIRFMGDGSSSLLSLL